MSNREIEPEKNIITEYLSYGRKNLALIYILLFTSFVINVFFFIAGLLIFLNFKEADKYSDLGSHYNFLWQTFWKSMIAYFISTILIFVIIGVFLIIIVNIFVFIRLAFGLKYFISNEPYPNPDTNWIK